MTAFVAVLGGETYRTKKAVEERCRDILYGRVPIDHAFLLDLLGRHTNAKQKIGCGVLRFEVRREVRFETSCFWLVRVDGSETDWSFKQCITAKSRRTKVLAAMRGAVVDQVISFRKGVFAAANGKPVCAVTGQALDLRNCHVDHHPLSFLTLAEDWVQHDWDGIVIEENVDRSVIAKMLDPKQISSWQSYHQKWAELRLVTQAVNLSKKR